ncbi:hypothetical protein LCGC14_1420890 [marine sediment metagenome]|uniref:Damage-inducible protein DinB n=2 Tax=root TaxID=1 RepID=A0A831VUC2_9FLAO|nr:damage-inducible protein DinB [Pricia antarctica]
MKPFFNSIFDYNFHCNKKLIEVFSTIETVPEKSGVLFSHILNAHHIWNARIRDRKPEFEVWQLHDIKTLGDIHYDNQRNSFEIVSNTEDFEKRIDYENTENRLFTNTVQDILFHIINHSTNHRGQIASDFKSNGLEPLVTDYIHYKR